MFNLYNMDTLKRDEQVLRLKNEMSLLKDQGLSRTSILHDLSKKNVFMRGVYLENKRIEDKSNEDKNEQKERLMELLEYIDDVIQTQDLSKTMVKEAKFQRKNILSILKNY